MSACCHGPSSVWYTAAFQLTFVRFHGTLPGLVPRCSRRATMTPRTRRLYSFKESPMRSSQELQAFNKSINCKRLRFDQDADGELLSLRRSAVGQGSRSALPVVGIAATTHCRLL